MCKQPRFRGEGISDSTLHNRIDRCYRIARDTLIAARNAEGFWEGRLSTSALSTATAMSALAIAGEKGDQQRLHAGGRWLADTRNADGGWGDTADSPSNLSTTLLAVCALRLAGITVTAETAEYLRANAGESPGEIASAVTAIYGSDRTFAVPILMNCALAGLVDWSDIPELPFELSVFPQSWFKALRLHVVSYALPALIAIGLCLHRRNPSRNPLKRVMRNVVATHAILKLAAIQPPHGGFLEAIPLTSFVAMALLGGTNIDNAIEVNSPSPSGRELVPTGREVGVRETETLTRCLTFLRTSQREDGGWPIDIDLSVWLTSSAVHALHGEADVDLSPARKWLSERQSRAVHPYTGAAPGGWGWSHRPGAVPDTDDTAGALIALRLLGETGHAREGVRWLLDLQNADGGWPTFCRGWGQLPFDRSSPDLTAHALRALQNMEQFGDPKEIARVRERGSRYLTATQRADGAWTPLWFGNQHAPGRANPVLGTARVLTALAEMAPGSNEARKGVQYLLDAQNTDGGWGGARGVSSSMEETALSVIALSAWRAEVNEAVGRGVEYLLRHVESENWTTPTPIGLYFASLWYDDALYPIIWTVEALGRARRNNT